MELTAKEQAEVLTLKPAVVRIALRIQDAVLFRVPLDDLIQVGWLGAIESVQHYHPGGKATLQTYAQHRMRGAMMDYLRHIDPLSRDHRGKVQDGTSQAPVEMSISAIPATHHPSRKENHVGRIDAHRVAEAFLANAGSQRNRDMLTDWLSGMIDTQLAQKYHVNWTRVSQIRNQAIGRTKEQYASISEQSAA